MTARLGPECVRSVMDHSVSWGGAKREEERNELASSKRDEGGNKRDERYIYLIRNRCTIPADLRGAHAIMYGDISEVVVVESEHSGQDKIGGYGRGLHVSNIGYYR